MTSRLLFLLICLTSPLEGIISQSIPLPEHPRPDFERPLWQNLNGTWDFAFDSLDQGIDETWYSTNENFTETINVPFPWGSKLSGVEDKADLAWYRRSISIDPAWDGQRIFITVGASDWETKIWLDGHLLGSHKGGYVPFSFEITDFVRFGEDQNLVVRVDDIRRDFTLYGKQGYGNARGIWQTVYLEARGSIYLDEIRFTPNVDEGRINFTASISDPPDQPVNLTLTVQTPQGDLTHQHQLEAGKIVSEGSMVIEDPRLWSLEDPYLYDVKVDLAGDIVQTYFGMRKISVMNMPDTDHRYIALNDKPIYLQMALDQSYHPDGYYTFPSDQFLIDEINRSKSIGLNGIRTHIKVEVPRKLYWADKLGLLVMEDLPNSWGEPGPKMKEESEYTLRKMIERDYNHPSIFSWCVFNETWGLKTKVEENGKTVDKYLPATQFWVASMYYLTKSLDPTRLVEDNSICCGRGHTETDINSWHAYLPGWAWEDHIEEISKNTYPGSTFDFEKGFQQGNQPNFNSECGNVWGYEGSTGDVDWSYDYHRMINTFRKYPKIAGWLYTEHHDVINEWNGYWRFDRSEKFTGMGQLVPGMTLNDLHSEVYLSTGNEITFTAKAGSVLKIPLYLSVMTDRDYGDRLTISYQIELHDRLGNTTSIDGESRQISYKPYMQETLDPWQIQVPTEGGLAIIQMKVTDMDDMVLQYNFASLEIVDGQTSDQIFSVSPGEFQRAEFSAKQWNILDGLKACGTGKGFFEYRIPVTGVTANQGEAYFIAELSSKELFVKDQQDFDRDQDYMRGSRVAPSSNPNSYPMTDEQMFPSEVSIWINGHKMHEIVLPDDPADHRGILSWHHQPKDRKLREAGSYGYLVKVPLTKRQVRQARQLGHLEVRIQSEGDGGVAVYGRNFGRYPIDPSLVLK